jgi:hypothetical protein
MTIRTPARFIGRTNYRPTDDTPPASAFLGPRATDTHSRGMADMLAQIAVTFGGATHLASIELPNGRWLCVTTN